MKPFIHISVEIDGEPMGLSLTREEIKVANKLLEENPEKYSDGKEILQLLLDVNTILEKKNNSD